VTAQDPERVPDAAAPQNTFSYITIACGILAFVISWLIFGVLGIALALVARGRRERRWKTAMIVAVVGMALGFLSVVLL
jgi:uncharacterized oligopeptide transporter (OPT) family protein